MPEHTVVEILRRIDEPAEPRPEFAASLRTSLLEELEHGDATGTEQAPSRIPRLQRHPMTPPRAPHPGWPRWARVAVAAAAAFLVVALEFVLVRPDLGGQSALAVMREARAAFVNVPSFEATVVKRTPGPWIQDEVPGLERPVPDRMIEREIVYLDPTHFRNRVSDLTWDVEGPPNLITQVSEGVGDTYAADGGYFATYLSADTTFSVEPIQDPKDLRFFAAGELMPSIEFMSDPGEEYVNQHCEVLPDETMFGRTVHRVHCTDPNFRQYEGGPTLDLDTYVDAETGMLFKMESRNEGVWFEVTSIEFSPGLGTDDFELQVPEGAAVQWLGDGAPPERFRTEVDPSVTSIPVGNVPEGVASGAGSIWVTYTEGGTGSDGEGGRQAVARIDPATNEVTARIVAPTDLTEIPKGWSSPLVFVTEVMPTDDAVYIAYHDAGNGDRPVRIAAIDPTTNTLGPPMLTLDRVNDGYYGANMAFAGGSLWVCDTQGGEDFEQVDNHTWPLGAVLKVDPATGDVLSKIPIEGNCGDMEVVGDSLWFRGIVPNRRGGWAGVYLFEVDMATGAVDTYPIPEASGDTAYGDGTIWITDYQRKELNAFDVETGQITDQVRTGVPTGMGDAAIAWGEGFVWETNSSDNSLRWIDSSTLEVFDSIQVGASPLFLTVAEGSVWVANYRDGTVSRVDVSSPG